MSVIIGVQICHKNSDHQMTHLRSIRAINIIRDTTLCKMMLGLSINILARAIDWLCSRTNEHYLITCIIRDHLSSLGLLWPMIGQCERTSLSNYVSLERSSGVPAVTINILRGSGDPLTSTSPRSTRRTLSSPASRKGASRKGAARSLASSVIWVSDDG